MGLITSVVSTSEDVSEADRRAPLRSAFSMGFKAGFLTLALWFLVRLGGFAPFPPESAFLYFTSIVPASVEEPAVQSLGELAGLLGLLVAALAIAAVYGLLAIVFERYWVPFTRGRSLSDFSGMLAFSLVPWLLFGAIVFPLTGSSFFGVGSDFAAADSAWAFPLTIILFQLLWVVLLWGRMRPLLALKLAAPGGATEVQVPKDVARREFVVRAFVYAGAGILVLASLGTALGTLISEGGLLSGESILPGTSIDTQNEPAIFMDPRLGTLVGSEVTSNDSFYRVAIDVFDPGVDVSTWSLAVTGLVGRPKTYSLDDLKALPKSTEYDTFICVSNLVNGDLISNAEWGGVKLSDLFADAGGVDSGATYVVFYSFDGYSVGVPLSRALSPNTMLAYEMNGVDLPQRHGYPLRAVIPGLYGMMSAKWVRGVQLTDSTFVGYWQTRGWTNDATVQTVSFIRVPQDGVTVSLSQNGGTVMLGGVAFAGDRGISKVEVSVDGGSTWQEATLKPSVSKLSWVLWAFEWTPSKTGNYLVYARATDGGGSVQTSAAADSFPSGATGYAVSAVDVAS